MLSDAVGFTKMEKCQSPWRTIWRKLKNDHKSNVHSEHLDKMPFLQMAAVRAEGEARLKGRRRKERTTLALEMGILATKRADARCHFKMISADGEVDSLRLQ